MDNSLTQQLENEGEEKEEQEEVIEGIPVCGADLLSPVIHTSTLIGEAH